MPDQTVFDIITQADADADADPQARVERLQRRLDALEHDHGATAPRPFTGSAPAALDAAERALNDADAARSQLADASAALPAAERRLAQASRSANGIWILLGAIGVIGMLVLIGQVFW